jgi:acetoacetate decarboxylase
MQKFAGHKLAEAILARLGPAHGSDVGGIEVYPHQLLAGAIEEASLLPFIPASFELASDQVQVAVMRFDCQVPERRYYDAAVIALVRYKEVAGGFWPFTYNSTDQAMSGTCEIWGYNMKLAEMEISEGEARFEGVTRRLGKAIISVAMSAAGETFETVDMFPRLFLKRTPDAENAEGVRQTVIKMDTRPDVHRHVTGSGEVSFGSSADDPLHQLKITRVFGASFTTRHQVLP